MVVSKSGNAEEFALRKADEEQMFRLIRQTVQSGHEPQNLGIYTQMSGVRLDVPAGNGAFPLLMSLLTTPASIAGVPRIVVCSPP
jgi:histidinol dehydrogenase